MKLTQTQKICYFFVYSFLAGGGQFFFPLKVMIDLDAPGTVLILMIWGLAAMLTLHLFMAAMYIFYVYPTKKGKK